MRHACEFGIRVALPGFGAQRHNDARAVSGPFEIAVLRDVHPGRRSERACARRCAIPDHRFDAIVADDQRAHAGGIRRKRGRSHRYFRREHITLGAVARVDEREARRIQPQVRGIGVAPVVDAERVTPH